jgi:peptidase inhibitor family I36
LVRIIGFVGRTARIIGAAVTALLLASCESNEPLGPTPLDQGIVVYLHSGYRGVSQQVGADVDDLGKIEGPCNVTEGGLGTWNDCVSSIRVLPGWSARIYGDKNYRGGVLDVNADIPDLSKVQGSCSGSYNDCISSIRVFKDQ